MVYDMKPYDTLRDDTAKKMKIEVKEKKKKKQAKELLLASAPDYGIQYLPQLGIS